jgi:hypothetical protein
MSRRRAFCSLCTMIAFFAAPAFGQKQPAKLSLLDVKAGQVPPESAFDDRTKPIIVTDRKELGGKAMKVVFAKGDSVCSRGGLNLNWSRFAVLRFDSFVPGTEPVELELVVHHSGSTGHPTRVVVPLKLSPGKAEISLDIEKLKNVNGSAPNLKEVRRWIIADTAGKAPTVYFSDIWLEGEPGSHTIKPLPVKPGPVHGDPARLTRIKAAKMPPVAEPVMFDTPEADKILSALEVLPPDNPWNLLIEDWPLHPNSKAMIESVGIEKVFRYNPDMGFVLVPQNQKKVPVKLTAYPAESDPGPYPVPTRVPIEGWPAYFRREPDKVDLTIEDVMRGKPNLDADRHGIIVDPVSRKLYEFYRLTKTDKGWSADQASIFDLASNKNRPEGWTSSDAAGLPIFPSVVRYDELQRGVVDHALRISVRRSRRAYVFPARHFASSLTDENLPRMGERIRLRKDFDLTGFTPEVAAILTAMKRYGAFVADNGIEWAISVAPDERIPNLHVELRKVKGADLEVVEAPPGFKMPK